MTAAQPVEPGGDRPAVVADDELLGVVVRPQALVLTLCGNFLLDEPRPLFSGSLVEALTRSGVGEHAARTTVTRMSARGLLTRYRVAQKVYLSLTPRSEQLLREGKTRVWLQGAVNRSWTGEWTLLSFSIPESRRADRHQLRKRLSWEGFGLLHNGLWIAPAIMDVEKVLADLGPDTAGEVKVFRASAMPPTDVARLVADAWDLEALAARYAEFVARWGSPAPRPEITDDLARFLLLLTEWLLLVRIDPHLPVQLLPPDWPAVEAERIATELRAAYEGPAREAFRAFAEHGPVPSD